MRERKGGSRNDHRAGRARSSIASSLRACSQCRLCLSERFLQAAPQVRHRGAEGLANDRRMSCLRRATTAGWARRFFNTIYHLPSATLSSLGLRLFVRCLLKQRPPRRQSPACCSRSLESPSSRSSSVRSSVTVAAHTLGRKRPRYSVNIVAASTLPSLIRLGCPAMPPVPAPASEAAAAMMREPEATAAYLCRRRQYSRATWSIPKTRCLMASSLPTSGSRLWLGFRSGLRATSASRGTPPTPDCMVHTGSTSIRNPWSSSTHRCTIGRPVTCALYQSSEHSMADRRSAMPSVAARAYKR